MAWLFERTIELAAWVAFLLGAVFLVEAIIFLVEAIRLLSGEPSAAYIPLARSAQSAAYFVGSALALGTLACIDKYVFDLPGQA